MSPAFAAPKEFDLREYKISRQLDIDPSCARLFKIRNRFARTSISDPSVAEPVVVSERDFYVIGKRPGSATLFVWDDAGGVVGIDVEVAKKGSLRRNLSDVATFFHRRLKLKTKTRDFSGANLDMGLKTGVIAKNSSDYLECTYYLRGVEAEADDCSCDDSGAACGCGSADSVSDDTATFSSPKRGEDQVLTFDGKSWKFRHDKVDFPTSKTLKVSYGRSRVFRLNDDLKRLTVDDVKVSDTVIVTAREIVLIGRSPGKTVMGVEDIAGNKVGFKTIVEKNGWLPFAKRWSSETLVKPADVRTIEFTEVFSGNALTIGDGEPKFIESKGKIVRIVVSDPDVVTPIVLADNKLALVPGVKGNTTVFLWNDCGGVDGVSCRVLREYHRTKSGAGREVVDANDESNWLEFSRGLEENGGLIHEVEVWTGSKKDVISIGSKLDFPAGASHVELNNKGVIALMKYDYPAAIYFLRQSLNVRPGYPMALANIAIAYNNWALASQKEPRKAMRLLHRALVIDPDNNTTVQNLDGIMRYMNRDPKNFQDHIDMAEISLKERDYNGAVYHYREALDIKSDPAVQKKLEEVLPRAELH
ncbi:MAG: pilus assembly protein N-terminal domain-containing protein [Cyanobacteria bacterium HKST-UBA01]|nr:pilus assembly protein N-terminal domain-containing protein [Cyanobacteria bacterium HKST-UBA01]